MRVVMIKKISRVVLYVFLSLALIALVPASWYVYGAYFVDHTRQYHECGGSLPISVPFNVSKKGEAISCRFRVDQDVYHQISLRYYYTDENFQRVISSVGGWGGNIKNTYSLKLKYQIQSIPENKEFVSGVIENPIVRINQSHSYIANILSTRLTSGEYELTIESMVSVPEIDFIKTDLYIDLSPISK